MKKRKYSFNDRVNYHKSIYQKFVDTFRSKTENGVSLDWRGLDAAEKKNSKISYSSGFCSFVSDISRGHEKSKEDLKKESQSYQSGYSAAKKAFEKSRKIKF